MINYSIEVIILDSWEEDSYTSEGYKCFSLLLIANKLYLCERGMYE